MLDAAEAVLAREGPEIALDAIATEAGVSKPILYSHVGDRGALVHALSERLLARIAAGVGRALAEHPEGRDALRALIEGYLQTVADESHLYSFVSGASSGDASLGTTLHFARRAAPQIAAGLDPSIAEPWSHGIIGMLHMTALWWLHEAEPKRSAAHLAENLTQLLWPGLADMRRT